MRRFLLATFAFAVGLTASLTAARLSDASHGPRPGDMLGSVDFDPYCRHEFGDRSIAVLIRPDAYGWRCASMGNGMFATHAVVFDEACSFEYGTTAYAVNDDPSWAARWHCRYGSRP